MKKYYFVILLLLPLLMWAQGSGQSIPGDPALEDDMPDADGSNYGMSGVVGAISIDGVTYSQVRLRPEISLGKFGFGLDIDMLIDPDGNIREEDWDDWQDYINKIFYVRFAQRNDPFYFKVGSIPAYTLGHGLIFNQFSNMLRYPDEKNVGGYVGINTPISGLGFEVFTHNVHKNEIIAGRAHFNPLQYTQIPLLENLKLGANAGMDRNQYGKYPDTDDDGIPDVYDKFPNNADFYLDSDNDGIADNVDPDLNGNGTIDHPDHNPYVDEIFPDIDINYPNYVFDTDVQQDSVMVYNDWRELSIYSLDYVLPLVQTDLFYLDHYGEYATIDKFGSGFIFPGFSSKFLIFDAKFEFRNFTDEFIPGYFDQLYEDQRSEVSILNDGDRKIYGLTTKEEYLKDAKASMGWFGYLRANLYDMLFLKAAYQDMYGADMNTGKSLWASVTANPSSFAQLKEASLTYSQTNVPYIDFLNLRNNSAYVSGRLVYGLSEGANLVGKYSEVYMDINGDGKIKGKDEVINTMAFGVEFNF